MISPRQVVAKGFTVNREAKPVSGKSKLARNLRKLREAIEPAENELVENATACSTKNGRSIQRQRN